MRGPSQFAVEAATNFVRLLGNTSNNTNTTTESPTESKDADTSETYKYFAIAAASVLVVAGAGVGIAAFLRRKADPTTGKLPTALQWMSGKKPAASAKTEKTSEETSSEKGSEKGEAIPLLTGGDNFNAATAAVQVMDGERSNGSGPRPS
jgi:hypothetical protein